MAQNNAVCSICGKEYHMCVSCQDAIKNKPWQLHTCCSEHYKVYQIIHGYSIKVYNKQEARKRLENVDLSDLENFRDNIKSIIKDIIKEENYNVAQEITEHLMETKRTNRRKVASNEVKDNTDIIESVEYNSVNLS